jgi:hypothetical protein
MKELDEALAEIERLQAENERLEALVYRLRTSERRARQSSLSPCEQVTLKHWANLDKIRPTMAYRFRNREGFPQPCATFGAGSSPLYDLDALRTWKRDYDEKQEAHRALMLEKRLEDSRWMRETYVTECS